MLNLRIICILITTVFLITGCENKTTEHKVLLMPAIDKSSITISFREAGDLLTKAIENNDREQALIILEKMMLLSETNSPWQSEYLVAYVETVDPDSQAFIATQFDPEEGFNILLVEKLKEKMGDPDSFKHKDTQYKIENRHVVVHMTYHEKNAFGDYELKQANAGITDNGYVILSDKNFLAQ